MEELRRGYNTAAARQNDRFEVPTLVVANGDPTRTVAYRVVTR